MKVRQKFVIKPKKNFSVIFLQCPEEMMERKKTEARGKTHYRNGRRGGIRKSSETGTISSQHPPPETPLTAIVPAFYLFSLLVASFFR
jgi:hypothetical protein